MLLYRYHAYNDQVFKNSNSSSSYSYSSSFSSSESNKKSLDSENYEIFIEPIDDEKEFFSNKYSELFKKYNATKEKNDNNEYLNNEEKKLLEIMSNLMKKKEFEIDFEENFKNLILNEKNKKILDSENY